MPWHKMIRKALTDRDLAGGRILEIGCGRGGFACWLAGQMSCASTLVAADFSHAAVAMGKAYALNKRLPVHWQVMDIQQIGYPDDMFDTVISCETIEHVPNPRRAVRELARVLKPGGRLFLSSPNYLNMYGLYRLYLQLTGRRFTEVGQPINKCTLLPVTLTWVRQAGLQPKWTGSRSLVALLPGRQVYLDALDRDLPVLRWLGLQSLIIAEKPTPQLSGAASVSF